MAATDAGQALRLLVASVALRVALVLAGVGEWLQWRVEVATPANSLLSVREGLRLSALGVSPYSGSQCRTAPLLLALARDTASHQHLYALPNVAMDVLAALMLRNVAQLTAGAGAGASSGNAVLALFLLNPLTVAACVAGTTTTAENFAVLALLWTCVRRRWLGAALALAACVYVGMLHGALLLGPAALLLLHGPEASTISSALVSAHGSSATAPKQEQEQPHQGGQHGPGGNPGGQEASAGDSRLPGGKGGPRLAAAAAAAAALAALSAPALLGLVWLSDLQVAALRPPAACIPHALSLLQLAAQRPSGDARQCWAHATWRLHLLVEDQTPNIGQLWYFVTEMFQVYLPFFRFVLHSLAVVLAVPLALRFPHRPLLLFTSQCLISCMFKPYVSAGDHALYLALLPLLQPQLAIMQTGMLLTMSFLLLAVLEGAMWHQWINIESANSNFLYSISLLAGAWQTLLLVQLLGLTVQVERLLKGHLKS